VRCAEEFPLLRQAEEKYRDAGLQVVYIAHQDRVEKLTPYAKANRVPDYFFDPDDRVSARFGMTYGGGVVFVNAAGTVVSRVPKGISPASIEAELARIIGR
jgi:hypothetical protein